MLRIAALPLTFALALAQEPQPPAQLPADLEALSKRVEAAHHPKGPVARVTAFDSSLELQLVDAKATQGGQVDARVRYFEYLPQGKTKARHLIRFEIRESGTPVESGRDRLGPWQMFQGQARDLTEADAQDRAANERNTNLARQLVRFLDPGEVLRALGKPGPVREESLQLGRENPVPCEVVEGELGAFPLLRQGGEDAPVRARVFVRKKESQLYAVEVTPLRDGVPDPKAAELVRLEDLHEQDGFLVPRQLLHLQRGDDGKLRLVSKAMVISLSLRPEFRVEDFDRPAK